MAAALNSANSARPSSLGSPVPGDDLAAAAQAFMSKEASAPPAVPEGDIAQAAQNFVNQDQVSPSANASIGPDTSGQQFAPEPGFAQANVDQFQNFVTRIQTGLAANDTEKLNLLKNKFGPQNVAIRDGTLYFRRDPKEKLQRLDPATLEVVNDLLPDFAREFVSEASMVPGEAAGAVAGGMMGGPAGAVTGARAGRVLSVPLANAAADKVASLAGVPEDETRSKLAETAFGAGAEATLPFIGNKIAKFLPGTAAYNAAKQAGEREIVALSAQSTKVAQAVEDLAREGRAATVDGAAVGFPGVNVSLMGHHLNPDSPQLAQIANVAAKDSRFINAQNQLAEDWGKSLENTLSEIARRGNKGPVSPDKLASTVTNAVADIQKAEGQAIGQFKAKAMANLKNERAPLPPEVSQQVDGLLREFGFTPRNQTTESITRRNVMNPITDEMQQMGRKNVDTVTAWTPPRDMSKFVGKMGLTSVGEVRAFVNNLSEVAQATQKGISISDLDRLRNSIGGLSDSLYRTQAGAELGRMSGGLRQAYRDRIASGLTDEFDKKAFNSAMDDFSQLKVNLGVIKGALNEDASAKAIVSKFFTGKENLQKIEAIKSISPESFGALKEEWINGLMTDYASRESKTGFKSSSFLDALDKKYGKQFVETVMNDGPGPNFDTVRKTLSVMERIEQQSKGIKADTASEQQKRGLMNLAIGLVGDVKFKKINGISDLLGGANQAKDSVLLDIMSRDGIDKYVASYPGRIDKKAVSDKLTEILARRKVIGQIGGAAARATRAYGREELRRGDNTPPDQGPTP